MRILIIVLFIFNMPVIANQVRKKEQIVNIGLDFIPPDLKIGSASHFQHYLLIQSLGQTLVRINDRGEVVSSLAKKWSVSKNFKSITFLLNDYKFSDSTDITSDHVISALLAHIKTHQGSFVRNYLADFLDLANPFEKISKHKFTINLRKPYPPFLHILTMPAFSIFKNEGLYDVGSGPYKIKGKYQTNELKLVRNKYSSLLGGAKELNIYNLKTSKKALKLINQIDVVFAASEQARNNFDTSEEGNFQVSSSQSLGFFHLYLNTSSPKLKNATLRKKIRSYYLKLDRNKFASIPFADKLNTYFPKNILLPSYYSDSPNKEKEGSYSILKDQELDVILDNVYFTAGFGEKLKKHFAKVGLKLNIKLTNPHELWTIKEEGNYDIITLGYMGNFPDPDGFLDPIYSSGLFNYLNSKDELVKDQVNEVKHLANAQMRLKSYERIIKEFEGLGYFLPGFQVQTPIIHNKRLSIPKAVYRYEGQIFDIIWQNLKKDL